MSCFAMHTSGLLKCVHILCQGQWQSMLAPLLAVLINISRWIQSCLHAWSAAIASAETGASGIKILGLAFA